MGCRILTFALIVVLAAGCTSDATDPTPTPTPSTQPTTTGSSSETSPPPTRTGPLTTGPNVRPGEKPPEYPELAKHHTANGALAFAIYYFKAFDWGYATNDPYLVAKIGSAQCKACSFYVRSVRSLVAKHEVLLGGRLTYNSATFFDEEVRIDSDFVLDISVSEEPVLVCGPGSSPSTVAPRDSDDHSLVFVSWIRGSWKVVEVTAK